MTLAGFLPLLVFFLRLLNSRGLPIEIARVNQCTCSIRIICFSMACLNTGSSMENKQRFRDLAEGFQRPIEGVLLRIGMDQMIYEREHQNALRRIPEFESWKGRADAVRGS